MALNTFHTHPHKGSNVKGQELNDCYQGELRNGRRHGEGTYTYANGFFTYQGTYVDGAKHGQGKLTSKDGSCYEGSFVHDEITGHGTKRFANGNSYTGEFLKGQLCGQGIMQLASGERYEGQFSQNCFNGRGVYQFNNGDLYQGEFSEHKITGQGTMAYANSERYEGEWLNGKRSGQGTCSFNSHNKYEGSWRDDVFNGEGSLWVASKRVTYRGLFVDGRPSALPSKLNITWLLPPEHGKGPRTPQKKNRDELPPPLPVTLGQPLTTELTVSAQYEAPLPPAPADAPPAPPPSKSTSSTAVNSKAPPPPPVATLIVTEAPTAGNCWETGAMENGREADVTLHASPPQPLAAGKALTAVIASAMLPDGTVGVLLVLLEMHVDAALPIGRTPSGSEALYGLRTVMEAGQVVLPPLCLGADPHDVELLHLPGGIGALTVTSWGLRPGFVRLALPEGKHKSKH